jgi:hypothetical protein
MWVLGVDIGTSFAAAAVGSGGAVELLEVGGERRVPTTVLLTEDGRLVAGSYAQRAVGRLPDRAERNPRRYVGRAPMLLGGRPVTAVDALSAVLALFVQEGRRRHDDTDPARLVLTHPIGWTADRVATLREVAARVLPRVDVELVPEPVAAARFHGVGGPVAVYDLGGATFDATVLGPDGSLLGRPGGDPDLGGDVFDQLVYRHFGSQLEHAAPEWWDRLGRDPERLVAESDLLTEARLAKEALSMFETASQYVAGADADVHISRSELDDLIGDDVRRSARILAETAAGTGLAAVLLTGGAARTPLVERVLREQHGALVRTSDDPKATVSLGAARLALTATDPPPLAGARDGSPAPDTPRAAPRSTGRAAAARLVPIAEEVLDAQVVGDRLYVWSAPEGPSGRHRIARIDPHTGGADRKIRFGRLVGWAVAAGGIIVAERRDGALHCHTLTADLSVGTSAALPTPYRPFLLAEGGVGWAVLRSPDTRTTGPQSESGSLAVQVFPLGPGNPGPVLPLGPAGFGYLDGSRRLLDPAATGSAAPARFGDGRSVALVLDRGPGQAVYLVGPGGDVTAVAEPGGPVSQVLASAGRWLVATAAGLESCADLRRGTDRRVVLHRPSGGAVRWVVAGRSTFGLAVDRVSPGRRLTVHSVVDGRRHEVGRWPSLLGSPAAARPDEAARVRADGDDLLLGVGDGAGGSLLVAADATNARVLAGARGWLEPVGRAGGVLLARHVPAAPPGDGCAEPGRLVRVGPG